MRQKDSVLSRVVLSLFALPFAAGGVGLFLFLCLPMLVDWGRMQAWVPAQAELIEVQVHRGKSDTYRVEARYRYAFGNDTHLGERVAITSRADNIGDFQYQLGARLADARARGEPVPVWVNPAQPGEAVLDRSFRPGLLALQMVMVLMFAGFGFGFLAYAWRKRPAPAEAAVSATASAPAVPGDNAIRSTKKWEVWVAWGFSLVWNGISAPILFLHLPAALSDPTPPRVIAMVFPLIGLALLIWAIRASRDAWRFRRVRLVLDPFPGALGGDVGGSLIVPLAFSGARSFALTLDCRLHTSRHNGSETESVEQLVWETRGAASAERHLDGTRLSFRFDVPRDLPASGGEHIWRLSVASSGGAPHFVRQFEIPVQPTGARSAQPRRASAQHPEAQRALDAQIAALGQIEALHDGLRLYLPYARALRTSLSWLVMSVSFGGVGLFMALQSDAPVILVIVFCLIGACFTLLTLYSLGNSLRVQIDSQGLLAERRVFGIPAVQHRVARRALRHLALRQSYQTQTGTRRETTYRLVVETTDGRAITVSDNLKGQPLAEALLARFSEQSGLKSAV